MASNFANIACTSYPEIDQYVSVTNKDEAQHLARVLVLIGCVRLGLHVRVLITGADFKVNLRFKLPSDLHFSTISRLHSMLLFECTIKINGILNFYNPIK